MFYSDEETGDVFLRDGFTLEPSRNYFIRLQVKGNYIACMNYFCYLSFDQSVNFLT